MAKKVSDSILEVKGVRSSTVINKDDAVRIFKDQFGEDILDILGYNPLPISAVVNLKRNSEELLNATPIVNDIKKYNPVLNNTILKKKMELRIPVFYISDKKIDSLKYGQSKNFIFDVNTSGSRSQSLDYLNDFAEVRVVIGG